MTPSRLSQSYLAACGRVQAGNGRCGRKQPEESDPWGTIDRVSDQVLVALVGLGGVLVGAFISGTTQWLLARREEQAAACGTP